MKKKRRNRRASLVRLTAHFRARWAERVGEPADMERVRRVHAEALCVRPQRRVFIRSPSRFGVCFRPRNINAVFWHPARGLVLIVDEAKRTAVTVFSYRDWQSKRSKS